MYDMSMYNIHVIVCNICITLVTCQIYKTYFVQKRVEG